MPNLSDVQLDSLASLVNEKVTTAKDSTKPYVGLEHLPSGGSSLLGTVDSGQSISTNNVFRRGDVLFGKLRPRLRKSVRVPFDGYCSTDILVLRPTANIDPSFTGFVLQSDAVFAEAIRTEEGTKMPRCSWSTLRKLGIFCPGRNQQQRIAEILSTVDEAIEQTEALIAKTQQIKAGLMHDLFTRGVTADGQLRPPREEAPQLYKESPLGWIPKEWVVSQIRELASLVTSGSRGWAAYYATDGALFVRSQNVRMGHLDFSDRQHAAPPSGSEGQRTKLCARDLLVTITGNSVGNVAFVPADWTEVAFVSQHVGLVRFHDSALAELATNFLVPGAPGNQQLVEAQYGQSKPGLNLDNLRNLQIPIPRATERELIVGRLSAIQTSIEYEIKYVGQLRALKQGLMDNLLTGRVRLTHAASLEVAEAALNV